MYVSQLVMCCACVVLVYRLMVCCGLCCVCLSAHGVLWIALCQYLSSWDVVACVVFVLGLVDIVACLVVYVSRLGVLLHVLYSSICPWGVVTCVVYVYRLVVCFGL